MSCEQVCDNKGVVPGWMEKWQARDLEAFQSYCNAQGASSGPQVGKGCPQRMATLALATWGCSRQASVGMERDSWTCGGDKGL